MKWAARRRLSGQGLVEFALVLPLFVLFVFTVIQLSLLFVWFYSETIVTRQSARWLAIHGNSLDASFAAQVQQELLPGMIGGTLLLVSAGSASADAVYRVGRMQVRFTPCLPSGTPTVCSHPSRAPGATLQVEMSYDASDIIFLPTNFQVGWASVTIPATLPAYRVNAMAE
jgi:hypothetical protein